LKTLARFAHQCSTLLGSGMGMVSVIRTLCEQPDHQDLQKALQGVCERIEQGYMLSRAMAEYPNVFGPTMVFLIKAGEESGQMDLLFARLVEWLEKDAKVVARGRQALVYPGFILGISLFLGWALFSFFLPPFFEAFRESGTELPLLTQMVLLLVNIISSPLTWIVTLGGAALLHHILRKAWSQPANQLRVWKTVYHLPLVGKAVGYAACIRFCNSLAILLDCGVPLIRSWTLAASASGSLLLEKDASRVCHGIREGLPLAEAIGESTLYPRGFAPMLKGAEESASIPLTLRSIANVYDQEVEQTVSAIAVTLEPLFIFAMALVVVVILLAVMLPLYGSLSQLGA
jgi:type II secretory pathway component PulF